MKPAVIRQDATEPPSRRWWVWVAVAVAVFMATLDSSIVNISLPVIARQLRSDLPSTQWVVLAYMLGIAAILLPVGRLSDLWGRRKVYVSGMIIFTLGSLLCGLAQSVEMLIGMRAVQAVGAAGLMASGPAVTAEAFQTERGKALGLTGSVVSLGTMVGPSLGGWIVETWGWPWIFWVNVPVGILSAVYAWRMLAPFDMPHAGRQSFDWWGATLSVAALFSLMFLLTYGMSLGVWQPLNLVLVVLFLLSGLAFVRQEITAAHPMIPFTLFRERLLTNSCVASLLSFVGITCIFFLVPFYLQVVRGYSPFLSGWILMTTAFSLFLFSPFSGMLSDRIGSRNLAMVGMVIAAAGLWLVSGYGADTPFWVILSGLFLVGMGNGLFQPPNNSQMLGSVPLWALGLTGGLLAIVRTLGMTFGVAMVGLIYLFYQAQLVEEQGFITPFRVVFVLSALLALVNALWIRWYRQR